jgi:hypothetical protein
MTTQVTPVQVLVSENSEQASEPAVRGTTTQVATVPARDPVSQALEDNYLRVCSWTAFKRVWERVLTPQERNAFPDGMASVWNTQGTIGLWMFLRRCSRMRSILDLAFRLNFLTETDYQWLLRETREDVENVNVACGRFPLVIVESPRAAYWRGEEIGIDWEGSHALWDYFHRVCEQASRGLGADASHFREGCQPEMISHRKCRLVNDDNFPIELRDLIRVSGAEHRLHLSPNEICFLRLRIQESLEPEYVHA